MKEIKYLFPVLTLVVILASCTKIEKISSVPNIKFTSFQIFDTLDILGNPNKAGRLKFHFEDGDGDLGLDAPSGNQPDTTNLFFIFYRKVNGSMVLAPDNDPLRPSAYRIPYLDRQGQNKILKGTISITFLYLFYSPSDTIRYDFYVKDRALNVSDTTSTGQVEISENKLFTK